jgi:hypothetical protein
MIVLALSCAALAAPAEFAGETFNTQRVLSSTSTFRNCTIRGCRAATSPNYEGGALCVSDVPVSLIVDDCLFLFCSAVDSGTAIFADTFLSVSVAGGVVFELQRHLGVVPLRGGELVGDRFGDTC